jgi:splicing factor U2AF 35 kDa subunit
MSGTTSSAMFMHGTNGRLKPRLQSTTSITAGMLVSILITSIPTCRPLRHHLGRPLYAELSPVTDFREACCRQNENGECNRGGFCNFMHLRLPSKELVRQLRHGQEVERRIHPPANAGGGGGWEPPKRDSRQRSASPHRGAGGEDRWSRRTDGEDRWTRKTDGEDRWTRKAN